MSQLAELLKQQAELNAKIEEIKANEKAEVVGKIRALIEQHGLTRGDIFQEKTNGEKKEKKEKNPGKVAPKYRNTATGAEWSGRGIAPKWIAGQDREKFLIK